MVVIVSRSSAATVLPCEDSCRPMGAFMPDMQDVSAKISSEDLGLSRTNTAVVVALLDELDESEGCRGKEARTASPKLAAVPQAVRALADRGIPPFALLRSCMHVGDESLEQRSRNGYTHRRSKKYSAGSSHELGPWQIMQEHCSTPAVVA
eukprot:TRINITY_DN17806_c0_g1_i1.p1 TRINITY_DN17806_c0_g1~~TRINITY_DN17806_c0_g1_i1.p1  ORF type:complete len:151 (+),score=28.11 TRINITY_DN17806_c0_g1_i1:79-531(+)